VRLQRFRHCRAHGAGREGGRGPHRFLGERTAAELGIRTAVVGCDQEMEGSSSCAARLRGFISKSMSDNRQRYYNVLLKCISEQATYQVDWLLDPPDRHARRRPKAARPLRLELGARRHTCKRLTAPACPKIAQRTLGRSTGTLGTVQIHDVGPARAWCLLIVTSPTQPPAAVRRWIR
jgi:hypothetical protein